MSAAIRRFANLGDGRRNLGVDVSEHVTVLVSPHFVEAQPEAESVAALVADHHSKFTQMESALAECRAALGIARAQAAKAEASLTAVLSGRRRFLGGPVLMKPAMPGAWSGEVWLLDPEKQERGLGIVFNSAAEVRRAYPELWVVGVTADGVLLDAAPVQVCAKDIVL